MQIPVRRAGGSLIVTLPKTMVDLLKIEAGDYISIPDDQIKIIKTAP